MFGNRRLSCFEARIWDRGAPGFVCYTRLHLETLVFTSCWLTVNPLPPRKITLFSPSRPCLLKSKRFFISILDPLAFMGNSRLCHLYPPPMFLFPISPFHSPSLPLRYLGSAPPRFTCTPTPSRIPDRDRFRIGAVERGFPPPFDLKLD